MSRTPTRTPESVANEICRLLYTGGAVTNFDMLSNVKATITRYLEVAWPKRKARSDPAALGEKISKGDIP